MFIDEFGSRRKGRRWVERNWPNNISLKLEYHRANPKGALEWAKGKQIYYDNTKRRWWFRDRDTAIQFKLMFGGKID